MGTQELSCLPVPSKHAAKGCKKHTDMYLIKGQWNPGPTSKIVASHLDVFLPTSLHCWNVGVGLWATHVTTVFTSIMVVLDWGCRFSCSVHDSHYLTCCDDKPIWEMLTKVTINSHLCLIGIPYPSHGTHMCSWFYHLWCLPEMASLSVAEQPQVWYHWIWNLVPGIPDSSYQTQTTDCDGTTLQGTASPPWCSLSTMPMEAMQCWGSTLGLLHAKMHIFFLVLMFIALCRSRKILCYLKVSSTSTRALFFYSRTDRFTFPMAE